jgi:hypothetical protein
MKTGTPVSNTDDFQSMVLDSVKAKFPRIPSNEVLKKLDPMGTHVVTRALIHGDGDFVRTWWYVKLTENPATDLFEVVLDMTWENFNSLPQIRMSADGENWEVVS